MCVTDCTGDALEAALAAALDEVVLPALATPSPARQAEVHLHQSLSHPRDAPSAAVLHLTVADGLFLMLLLLAPAVEPGHTAAGAVLASAEQPPQSCCVVVPSILNPTPCAAGDAGVGVADARPGDAGPRAHWGMPAADRLPRPPACR